MNKEYSKYKNISHEKNMLHEEDDDEIFVKNFEKELTEEEQKALAKERFKKVSAEGDDGAYFNEFSNLENFVSNLRKETKNLGGNQKMIERLKAKRATFYRAISKEKKLPYGEELCRWLDKLNLKIPFNCYYIPFINIMIIESFNHSYEPDKITYVPFLKSLFNSINIKPENCVYGIIYNDDMFPTLKRGDSVIIDLSQRNLKDGGIFCISFGTQSSMIRRVHRRPGGWEFMYDSDMSSKFFIDDTTLRESIEEENNLYVYGRICWHGHMM